MWRLWRGDDSANYRKKSSKRAFTHLLGVGFYLASFLLEISQERRLLFNRELFALTTFQQRPANRESSIASSSDPGIQRLLAANYSLNDPTILLSPDVERHWLNYYDDELHTSKPKRKLLLTDFGWNHPNKTYGLATFPRSLRSRELLQGFVDHPDFDASFSWSDMLEGKITIDNSIEYVVMMDIETCFEFNYPYYVTNFPKNTDKRGGRLVNDKNENPCYRVHGCLDHIMGVLRSRLFRQVPASTSLLYLDCHGVGPQTWFRKGFQTSSQLSIASVSAGQHQLHSNSDMGMPPPAVNPVILSTDQIQAIQSCESESNKERPYLFSFVGSNRPGSPRGALFNLHNTTDNAVLLRTKDFEAAKERGDLEETFSSLLVRSLFAATPRGDNLFSFRFTEAMSAGAIPVVHADGWVFPFRHELVDWSECAVVVPEAKMNETIDILERIDPAQRCRRRQRCYDIYQKYMATPAGNIAGLVDSIEAARRRQELSKTGL